jgi:hypothetical protein
MYLSSNYVLHAPSQPHTHVLSEPVIQSFSQPIASQQTYSQRAELHAGQSRDSMPLLTTTHVQSAEQPTSLHSNDQWQTVSRKRYRNVDDHEPPNAKKTDCCLGGTIPLTIDSVNSRTKLWRTHPTKTPTRSTHPFSYQVSQT